MPRAAPKRERSERTADPCLAQRRSEAAASAPPILASRSEAPPPSDDPREFTKRPLSAYLVEPPDILRVQGSPALSRGSPPLAGHFLVHPDGTITLGVYGSVYVAGMTIDQAKAAIAALIQQRTAKDLTEEQVLLELQVDVSRFNSKFYYIIIAGGNGQQVHRMPCTGNETVLDAISLVGGLPALAGKRRIWVARASAADVKEARTLPVDWKAITQDGNARSNYQLLPGDRIYVQPEPTFPSNSFLGKMFSPPAR